MDAPSVTTASFEVAGEAVETPKEKEQNVTMDTANLSMESNGSFPTSSNPVLITSEPSDPLDDADIDVAAEQIVKEFTEHLNQRATPDPPMVEEGDNGEEDDACMGIMSSSLAAGGFEELIVALDAPGAAALSTSNHDSTTMEVLVMDNTENEDEDIVEEEVDEVSYDEEEIVDESMTEVEFMDDVDIEEIMEDSGMIMAEAQKPSAPTVEEKAAPAKSPDAPAETNESFYNSADTMDALATTTTVTTINSLNDSLAMDLSETTRNTAGEPLYGDVLLGDISEMTTGSKSGFYDPSAHLDASSAYAGGSSAPSNSPHSSVKSVSTPPPLSEANRLSLQSAYGEVAAVAAAAALSPHSAPVPPAMQGSPSLSTTDPLADPVSATFSMTETSNIVVPNDPAPYHPEYSVSSKMNVPVPPALSGAPSEVFSDLEAGGTQESDIHIKEPEMAQSFSMNDAAKEKTKEHEEVDITEGMNLSIYGAGLLCLLVIFIAVILSVVLTRGGDSSDRSIPSPAPVAVVPVSSPVAAPTVVTPPIVLGIWAESIAPVFGSPGSNFGAAIVVDDNNMWSVGAPNMADESGAEGTGSVITSTFVSGNWELIPALYGKNAGDAFGTAIDLYMNHMIIGAPNALIANTSTPAGAAYYYSFDPSSKIWTESDFRFRSNDDLLSSNGAFGAAVALGLNVDSGIPRVVVGAPKYNLSPDVLETGGVYTFEAATPDGLTWSPLGYSPITGRNANDWFGASVDMSVDGSHIIVGAPGANTSGYFQVYEWDGSQWKIDYEQDGVSGEGLGSSVVLLTTDVIAVGGPGYENGSGRVLVYQESESGYVTLGEPIVGNPGDRLGSAGTITGGEFGVDEELLLIVSSTSGVVMTYVFDTTQKMWQPRFETLSTGNDASVVLEYSSSTGLIVGYPTGDEVSFYNGQAGVTARPTSAPTIVLLGPVTAAPSALVASPVTNPPTTLVSPPVTTSPTTLPATNSTAPTSDGAWMLAGASFTPATDAASGFGSSVSLTSTTMVVGAPNTLENGAVFLFNKNSGIWTTEASQQIFGNAAGMDFGAAVDLSSTLLAVGAPRAQAPSTLTEFGAVYPYSLVNGQWEALGATILGDEDIYSASEMFGSAVAVASAVNRIAVGAPFSNLDNLLLRGRVYVYEFSSTSSIWTLMQTMAGQDANHFYGTSIDLSPDGTQLVVGAPGGGYAEFWEYDGSSIWTSQFLINQGTSGFGTVVVWIAGNLFAVGDPNFNSDSGRVVLYQKDATLGTFVQLGSDLTGTASGEQFGKTLVGSIDPNTSVVTLIVGTSTGSVRRVDLDSTKTWAPVGAPVTTNVTSLAAASAQEFVVGGSNAAEIYQWSV